LLEPKLLVNSRFLAIPYIIQAYTHSCVRFVIRIVNYTEIVLFISPSQRANVHQEVYRACPTIAKEGKSLARDGEQVLPRKLEWLRD
jgi:hypothetical protein